MSHVPRSLFVHAGLLAAAATFAVAVFSRDKSVLPEVRTQVTVWPGRGEDVEYAAYEAKGKKVTLEPRSDAQGKWYLGTIVKDPAASADGGTPEATTTTFVSTTAAAKLFDALAPLEALRDIGKVPAEREEEFGLKAPEGALVVKVSGLEHKLDVGGPAPGGADRYVRNPETGSVYAVKGDLVRDFEWADSRLLERQVHAWKDSEVTSVTVRSAGKARTLVRRGAGNRPYWADPAVPEKNDETAGNWMQKLDRLRPSEYIARAPEERGTVVRVEYAGKSGPLGWIEVVNVPSSSGRGDYFVATERTRLFGKVAASLAEQVETDVASVVK